jgi:hypothetical protein
MISLFRINFCKEIGSNDAKKPRDSTARKKTFIVTTQVPHDYVKRKGFPSKAQEIASIILRVCFWAVAV